MRIHGPTRRGLAWCTAGALALPLAGLTGALPAWGSTPSSAPAQLTASPATKTRPPTPGKDQEVLVTGKLAAIVSTTFPQVISYLDRDSGGTLAGTRQAVTSVKINGTDQAVSVTSRKSSDTSMTYTLTAPGLPGVALDASISLSRNQVTFRITDIRDTAENRVSTVEIPGLKLVTVSSAEPGAQLSTTRLSTDRNATGDTFTPITATTLTDAKPKGSAYALASTGTLAAAVESNSLYDASSGPANLDGSRFFSQVTTTPDGGREASVASGAWLHRAAGSSTTEELPWAKVAITADANADRQVDWQDAAIALRSIAVRPNKGDQTADNVITHIPFNFASQATHPFLRTLDDVKRISLATDGLGQVAMLKGYTSEGHDSANTDYGNNFNERAGGLKDLNTLASESAKWNAHLGVHVNATEIYPEAKSFSEDLLNADKSKGWNWLDQSYGINQRADVNTGKLATRIKELRDATDKNLDFVYVDVYYSYGWVAQKIQDELVKNGFRVGSEWAYSLNRNNTWSHWANDEKYGGTDNKGINSQILRFVNNSQADVWNPDVRLGGSHIVEFEGWTGQNDYNAFTKNVWESNLPTKFLQHHEIMRWTPDRVDLTDGVSVAGTTAENRTITADGVTVLQGRDYLLPWSSKDNGKADKLYHYSAAGGTGTWTLGKGFSNARELSVYKLGDNGRTLVTTVPVVDGKVTLTAEAGQPYVLVPRGKATQLPAKAQFGSGTPFQDPGFNGDGLAAWNPQGAVQHIRDAKGRRYAELGSGASSISQKLGRLEAGTYSVSAWVEIEPGKTRDTRLTVDTGQGKAQEYSLDRSTARNYVAGDEKNGTSFQRVRVLVDVPQGGQPTVKLSAGDGDAKVRVDDFRAVKTVRAPGGGVVQEDFENVDQGWWPFIKGDAGGSTDPRTHLSIRNAPFTQKGWYQNAVDKTLNGNFSLVAHEENDGMVYRTSDSTVKLTPGHRYRVSFDYQNSLAGQYSWVWGYDAKSPVTVDSKPLPAQTQTTRFAQEFTAGDCGRYFTGLSRTGSADGADFVLDDFLMEDLGPATEVPACATVSGELGGDVLQQGKASDFTTVLQNNEPAAVSDVSVSLQLPEGWTAEAKTPATAGSVAAGAKFTTTWSVTAPGSADGNYSIGVTGSYRTTVDPKGPRRTSTAVAVKTLPRPPQADVYASDHDWVSSSNGWGPVERDKSNGEQGAGDGTPITLNGVVYPKGLGAHAPSTVKYFLGGYCTRFTADVGIDDVQKSRGSVIFSVVADGKVKTVTPVMRPDSATAKLDVDLTGAQYVELVADPTADGNGNDHADWGAARFSCSDQRHDAPAVELSGTVYASDLPWVSEANGWGPAERDTANGEDSPGDGPALTLDGTRYAKGIGVHADSSVVIDVQKKCTAFNALVGVDDKKLGKGLQGSVVFVVLVDGVEKFRSAVLSAPDAAAPVTVDITGASRVELKALTNGDDGGDDWGDWANARFTC
ncbi:endo-alpha-N-acetylgalactosaminidase family protein [Arthrobacter sp. RAF14]|uniref:endo-alpha-N-acetylgalactosaminidase family protein n=1 Tax=Arthrobacter sp. RAF14 TaxID=3233051 RepID=UPI003F915292